MGSFLGGIVGKLLSILVEWWGLIRVGERKQQQKDQAASLKDAKQANQIRERVDQETDADVDRDLAKFMRKPDA